MLFKTQGIVLHHIKYSETSIIAYLYTSEFGRQSYIIKGARRKKASCGVSLFQPLFLLEMEVFHNQKKELQNVKEVRNYPVFTSIPYDIRKSSIALFLSEILYKVLKEEEASPALFQFLYDSILLFDKIKTGTGYFHLKFLIALTKYLGFFPLGQYTENTPLFDMLGGCFIKHPALSPYFLEHETAYLFDRLIQSANNELIKLEMKQQIKNNLLEKIIDYYKLHLGVQEIKSFNILKSVFQE
ncbi:MAG: DNA repair protein RecO [Bacteroidia bacterium]|nr:DNA repair protein RecO [Bacteroidia bacterium]